MNLVVLTILLWAAKLVEAADPIRNITSIAVIGSGIGGASVTHYIQELLGGDVVVDVYEKGDRVGGRLSSFEFDGKVFELGASIMLKQNRHIYNLAGELNLTRTSPHRPAGGGLGLWDGQDLVYTAGRQNAIWETLKGVWRWGINMWRMGTLVRVAVGKFRRVYGLQRDGVTWESAEEFWDDLKLNKLITLTLSDYVGLKLGYKSVIELELIHGINRVNYNQDNNINALAGLVSLAPGTEGVLIRIEEGNDAIVQGLLKSANVTLSTAVTDIISLPEGQYELRADDNILGTYDAVVIAAPIDDSSINFKMDGGEGANISPGLPTLQYVTVHTTYVVGNASAPYFKRADRSDLPSTILLTEEGGKKEKWSSFALQHVLEDGRGLYKIFSLAALSDETLNSLFVEGWKIEKHVEWQAYPRLNPKLGALPKLLPFPGHPIIYLNAFESAVSAIEILTVSAKNGALLLCQYSGVCTDPGRPLFDDSGDYELVSREEKERIEAEIEAKKRGKSPKKKAEEPEPEVQQEL